MRPVSAAVSLLVVCAVWCETRSDACPGRLPFCKCDLSKPSTFQHEDGDEWCFLQRDIDNCVFGTGEAFIAEEGDNKLAPCWKVSGRGVFWQRQLQEPDFRKRCSPPAATAATCVRRKDALRVDVLSVLTGEAVPDKLSAGLKTLGTALRDLGFNHSAVMLVGQLEADAQLYPNLASKGLPAIRSDAADMIRLFVVGSPIPRAAYEALLPRRARAALAALGAVVAWGDVVFAVVQLFPVEGGLFLTDEPGTDGIMYIGVDSNGLAASTTVATSGLSRKVDILDVCTGSGVQGITAARHATARGLEAQLTLLDVNPRARRFVRANLMMNDVGGKFIESDVFAEVQSRTFDLILANTPFVPSGEITPGTWAAYTDGGPDGEVITKRVVEEGLPLLKPTGRMLIATPIYNEEDAADRLEAWGVAEGAAGALIVRSEGEAYTQEGYDGDIETVAREGIILISRCAKGVETHVVSRAWTAMAGCGVGPKWNNWMNCFFEQSGPLRTSVLEKMSDFVGQSCSAEKAEKVHRGDEL